MDDKTKLFTIYSGNNSLKINTKHNFYNSDIDSFGFVTSEDEVLLKVSGFETSKNLEIERIEFIDRKLTVKANRVCYFQDFSLTSNNKEIKITFINIIPQNINIRDIENNNTNLKFDIENKYLPTKGITKENEYIDKISVRIDNSSLKEFPEIKEGFYKRINILVKDSNLHKISNKNRDFVLDISNTIFQEMEMGDISIRNNSPIGSIARANQYIDSQILGNDSSRNIIQKLKFENCNLTNSLIKSNTPRSTRVSININNIKANTFNINAESADISIENSEINRLNLQSNSNRESLCSDLNYKDGSFKTKNLNIAWNGILNVDIKGYKAAESIIIDHKNINIPELESDVIDSSKINIYLTKIRREFNLKNDTIRLTKNINIPSFRQVPNIPNGLNFKYIFLFLIALVLNIPQFLGFGSTYPGRKKSQANTYRQLSNKFKKEGDTKNSGLFRALYNLQNKSNVFGYLYSFISNCGTSVYRPILWILLLNCLIFPYINLYLLSLGSYSEGLTASLYNAFKPFALIDIIQDNMVLPFIISSIIQLLTNISITSLFLISLRWHFKRE